MSATPTSPRARSGTAIALLIAVSFAVVALFVVAWFPSRERSAARAALQHKVDTQASLIAYTIAPAIDFDDLAMVDEVLSGASRDQDFVAVQVFDVSGTEIRARGQARASEQVVVAEVPVRTVDREVGSLRLTMSEARILEENRTQLLAALAIALTIAALGLLVALLVARQVQRVASLTEENARVVAAKERAEVRSRFMALLSHEIRTPLNGVLGIADVLAQRPLDPESSSLARSILRAGQSLLELINDVLDVAKLEAGRVEIERESFDAEAVAVGVVETLTSSAFAKGLVLLLDVRPSVPSRSIGDRHRLQQVLTNLVGNALKFTERGHVLVRLDAPRAGRLAVAVIDTGIGISPDKRASVFEAFSQADASTTRRYGGTGLGLTICRDLVRLMGGELALASDVGKGTTFSFEIEAPADGDTAEPAPTPSRGTAWVITEHEALFDTLARQLAIVGVEAVRASAKASDAPSGPAPSGPAPSGPAPSGPVPEIVLVDALRGPVEAEEAAFLSNSVRPARLVALTTGLAPHGLEACRAERLALPTSRAALADVVLGRSEPEPRAGTDLRTLRAGVRVLAADDDPLNRLVLQLFLERLGAKVEIVDDGAQVLARLERGGPFDALMIDGEMPVLDGFEAVRRLREKERGEGRRRLPVLMISAHAAKDVWPRASEAGADAYLAKPVTQATLVASLETHVPDLVETREPETATPSTPVSKSDRHAIHDSFVRSSGETLAALGGAAQKGDWPAVKAHAHKLKGSCLLCGATRAAEQAALVERAAAAADASVPSPTILEAVLELEVAVHEAHDGLAPPP
ncbi:MAG: response regulator [Sandaracinaceae bacterium]|nr:response regulator [Sandaracinaceae bacterium]